MSTFRDDCAAAAIVRPPGSPINYKQTPFLLWHATGFVSARAIGWHHALSDYHTHDDSWYNIWT